MDNMKINCKYNEDYKKENVSWAFTMTIATTAINNR